MSWHTRSVGRRAYLRFTVLICSLLILMSSGVHAVPIFLDPTFGTGGKVFTTFTPYKPDPGNDIAIQSDGKIVVAGSGLDESILLGRWIMSRYNTDGSLDTSFGTGGRVITPIGGVWDRRNSLLIQADGKIVVGGDRMFNTGDAFDSHVLIARYNPNGTLDATFGSGGITQTDVPGTNTVHDVALLANGKFAVAGDSNAGPFAVVYDSNGFVDPTFDGDGVISLFGTSVRAVSGQADGKVLFAGQLTSGFTVWRYNTNGTLDSTFDGDGFAEVPVGTASSTALEMLVKADGKFLTIGTATGTNTDVALVQFNSDGSPDTSFDTDGKVMTDIGATFESGRDIAFQTDGKIVAVGTSAGNVFEVIRYLANGTLDTTFDGDGFTTTMVPSTEASAVAIQSDGKILATGSSRQNGFAVLRFAPRTQPFDFEGDGRTDISIFRPGPGEWWYLRSSTGTNAAFQFGASSDKLVPADFTGDGKTDIAFWRPSTGQWFVLRSEDNSYYAHPFGTTGDIPAPADFDGDGKADEAVFRPANGTWYIARSSGGTIIQQFGQSGDAPVVADFDGDAKADIAIYRSDLAQWWILRSTAGTVSYQFGNSADRAVPGDYTGDGKADVAFWRPSTGQWFVLRSEDNSYYAQTFGTTADVPAPGDYDGDGRFDPTIFRPSTSTWWINRSSGGSFSQGFGISGDVPVPGAYVPVSK